MNKTTFALFTFANSHLVLKAEKTLENQDIKVIPLPSEISTGCGLSIMCDLDNVENIISILSNTEVPYKKVYKVAKDGLQKHIEEINIK